MFQVVHRFESQGQEGPFVWKPEIGDPFRPFGAGFGFGQRAQNEGDVFWVGFESAPMSHLQSVLEREGIEGEMRSQVREFLRAGSEDINPDVVVLVCPPFTWGGGCRRRPGSLGISFQTEWNRQRHGADHDPYCAVLYS